MTGRITRLIDNEQAGTITGDDGNDYVFSSGSLVSATFLSLHLGLSVSFSAVGWPGTRKAMRVSVTK